MSAISLGYRFASVRCLNIKNDSNRKLSPSFASKLNSQSSLLSNVETKPRQTEIENLNLSDNLNPSDRISESTFIVQKQMMLDRSLKNENGEDDKIAVSLKRKKSHPPNSR